MGPLHNPLREYLPPEMRLLPAVVGAVGAAALCGVLLLNVWNPHIAYHVLFGPWYMLTAAGVGLTGLCGAVWYSVGRPLVFGWVVSDPKRGASFSPRFSRGMLLAALGGALPLFVNGTSRFWAQAVGLLGVLLLTAAPLWYWVVSAVDWSRYDRWPETLPALSGRRAVLAGVAVLVVASLALTPVVALPISSADETATGTDFAVSITDVQRTQSIGGVRDRNITAGEGAELLVIEFTFENRGEEPRRLWSTTWFDTEVDLFSPACGNALYPACPDRTPYENFTAGGKTYDDYGLYRAIEPGEEYTSALVFEVPRRGDGGERPRLTFVVSDIGRWDVSDR
jgi:hypothetical protein